MYVAELNLVRCKCRMPHLRVNGTKKKKLELFLNHRENWFIAVSAAVVEVALEFSL